MKYLLFIFLLFLASLSSFGQNDAVVKGKIVNAANDQPMENVNIVNLNQVYGTSTNIDGEFEIVAKANDTLHLSFLGFKSIKVRVTNDWINFKGESFNEILIDDYIGKDIDLIFLPNHDKTVKCSIIKKINLQIDDVKIKPGENIIFEDKIIKLPNNSAKLIMDIGNSLDILSR